MQAMIRTCPPQVRQVSMSMLNTRLRRCAQLMDARRSDSVCSCASSGALGLLPLPRLAGVTHAGRSALLIYGTRAVLATVKDKDDRLSCWTKTLIERRGYKRAAVALAAKNARIVWALMVRNETYQLKTAI